MRKLDPNSSRLLISGALLGAMLMLASCQAKEAAHEATPDSAAPTVTHATIANEFTVTSQVVMVDAKTRVVTLRHADGELTQVTCGEAVQNFAQIAAGDSLHVRYEEKLEATLLPAGETAEPASAAAAAVGAEPGATPAGGVGIGITARVKIESVDLEHNIVVFSLASGELSARRLVTPEGQEFAKGLKVGDTVQLDYTEVLALAIEKV